MLDNGSVTSLASSQCSARSRTKSWRKPLPPFLPHPERRLSPPLSESDVFRQFAERDLSYSELDHPPLPENWRENIERALHQEQRGERPTTPTPDYASDYSLRFEDAKSYVDPSEKTVAETQHVVPTALYPQDDDRRQSDAGSTLAGSTRSTKLETVVIGTPGASIKTRSPRKTLSAPPLMQRTPTPPPRGFVSSKTRQSDADVAGAQRHCSAATDAFRIVYPDSNPGMGQMNRNAAVFPAFPSSATDLSLDVTAVEDGRSTLQSFSYPSTQVPAPVKREVSAYSYHGPIGGVSSAPSKGVPGCQSVTGWWYVVKQTMKSTFCMQPRQVQY